MKTNHQTNAQQEGSSGNSKTTLVVPLHPIITSELTNQTGDESLNEPLNIQSLRNCKGYENVSDAKLTEIVNSLKIFASILVTSSLNNTICIDNQQVVYLNKQTKAA